MRRQILGLGTIALLSLSISACSNEAQNNGHDADVSGGESLMTTRIGQRLQFDRFDFSPIWVEAQRLVYGHAHCPQLCFNRKSLYIGLHRSPNGRIEQRFIRASLYARWHRELGRIAREGI